MDNEIVADAITLPAAVGWFGSWVHTQEIEPPPPPPPPSSTQTRGSMVTFSSGDTGKTKILTKVNTLADAASVSVVCEDASGVVWRVGVGAPASGDADHLLLQFAETGDDGKRALMVTLHVSVFSSCIVKLG